MCKKFMIYIEDISTPEDEKVFWDLINKFAEIHGFHGFGTSTPWDKNIEEVEDVIEINP